jgi:L-proline amide hydrolase
VVAVTEGFVAFRGMRTWYRIAGDRDSGKVPLLLLHGGPGMGSDVFEPLEALAAHGRAVVRYDQIGCGYSDRPKDPGLWAIGTFVDELATVRRELGLDRVHLLGWSWGGMLAMEYLLVQGQDVQSLILASSPVSVSLWGQEARRLRDDLPGHVTDAMRRFEDGFVPAAAGGQSAKVRRGPSPRAMRQMARVTRRAFSVIDHQWVVRLASSLSAVPFLRRAAYEVVGTQFTKRHVIRMRANQIPLSAFRSLAGMNRRVYETMWGPSEFFATGNLTGWDATARLNQITVPTLITSGRYDEATPAQMQILHDGIAGSRWVVFERSAHLALIEEPDRYLAVLEEFLDTAEATNAA